MDSDFDSVLSKANDTPYLLYILFNEMNKIISFLVNFEPCISLKTGCLASPSVLAHNCYFIPYFRIFLSMHDNAKIKVQHRNLTAMDRAQ